MKTIDLNVIGEFLKKYGGWILSAILILIMLQCNGDTDHSGAISVRNEQNAKFQTKIDSLLNLNSEKDKVIKDSEKKIADSQIEIKDLNKKISAIKSEGEKKDSKVKLYSLQEWKEFYQDRTGFDEKDISVDGNTVKMTREPLVAIGRELVRLDVVTAQSNVKDQVIAEDNQIMQEQLKIIKTEREKGVNLQEAFNTQKEIVNNLKDNVSDLQKDLKQANKTKIKPILIGASVGFILGAILIH